MRNTATYREAQKTVVAQKVPNISRQCSDTSRIDGIFKYDDFITNLMLSGRVLTIG